MVYMEDIQDELIAAIRGKSRVSHSVLALPYQRIIEIKRTLLGIDNDLKPTYDSVEHVHNVESADFTLYGFPVVYKPELESATLLHLDEAAPETMDIVPIQITAALPFDVIPTDQTVN